MQTLINLAVFLLSILALVTVHEFGHFWVAKRLGVKVLKFSIGFGRPIWRHQAASGTEYCIAILPLGGYVKLLDESEGSVSEQDQALAFNRQPLWKRACIVIAGPGINILFAIFAFWCVGILGRDLITPVIGSVLPDTPAAEAQIPAHTEIVSLNDRPVRSWQTVSMRLVGWFGATGELPITVRPLGDSKTQRYVLKLQDWSPNNELQPDPLSSLGLLPYQPPVLPVIARIRPDSPAADANLKPGDRLLQVADQPIQDWSEAVKKIQGYPNQTISIQVLRDHQPITLNVKIGRKLSGYRWVGYLGIEPNPPIWPAAMQYHVHYSPWSAMTYALQQVGSYSAFHFVVLGKLITGQLSLRTMGGPISIYETTSVAFAQGMAVYISFLGLLSVMLACVNILPIPGLDGGHLLMYALEAIAGRPLSMRWQVLIIKLGFIFLILIMVQATINDVLRVIGQAPT